MSGQKEQCPCWRDKHYAFFQNRDCECFPCHAGADAETFSCLFCYCPLYALGDGCGGRFVYTEQGVKDCSGCLIPHRRENYGRITERLEAVVRLAAKKSEKTAGSEKI